MCMCGESILMHAVPYGEDKASHCLSATCDCPEFTPEA